MENVVNKFYTGGMTNFGFGTWNSLRPTTRKNINNTQNNNYNNMREIPAPGPSFLKTVRPLSTGMEPIPKTLLSMNNYNNNSNYNPYNSNYQNQPTGKTFLSPDVLKMQMLEQKIKQLELQNEDDKINFQNMMQKIQNDNENDYQNQINKIQQQQLQRQRLQPINNNMYQNPYNRNIDDDYELKRLERRRQVQYELEQAREKLNEDESSSSYEYDEDDDDEESEYNDRKIKKRKLDSLPSSVDRKSTQNSKNPNNLNYNKLVRQSKLINNQNEDTKDFMNQLPKHIALQMQSDNFKVRGNLAYIKNTFREIKDELENKLDNLEKAQKLNYESLRNVIAQGGNEKLKASIKKNLDGKDINLNQFEDDEPDYIKELPDMIDKKILENEEKRREDELREINEENDMREDENIILPPNSNKDNEKFIPNKVNLPQNNYNNYDFNKINDKNPYRYQQETNNDKTNFRNPIVDRYGNLNKNNKSNGKFNMNNMEQSEISNTEDEFSNFYKKKNTKSEKNTINKKRKIKNVNDEEEEENEDEEEESEKESEEKSEEKSSEKIRKKKLINKPLKLVNGEFVSDNQSEPKQKQILSRKIDNNPYIDENASEPLEKKNAKQKVRKIIEEFAPDSEDDNEEEEEDEEEENNDDENNTKNKKNKRNKKIKEENEEEEEDENDD